MSSAATTLTPLTFEWQRWPQTEAFVANLVSQGLEANAFAANLAERMRKESSTSFGDWLDHLVLSDHPELSRKLKALGYRPFPRAFSVSNRGYSHHEGMFPKILVVHSNGNDVQEMAIKVDSIADFSEANDLALTITGPPLGPYRVARLDSGESTTFAAVERRGYQEFDPYSSEMARSGRMTPQSARDALAARELWQTRRRKFDDDDQGMTATEATLERVIELAGGTDLACHLVFEVERAFWTRRNHAAQVQKARQDRLGLGWANHDHHTFRSSRRNFPRLIALFTRLGFEIRERFHAGRQAGWGAQIVEHPRTGIVIFADLDLAPEEADQDFSHQILPELPKPNTVGLWVGLHGESILDAGMHHLEAQFDFEALRDDLRAEAGVETMKPFSDFSFLRQAFTAGERWPVGRSRLDRLRSLGWIDDDQYDKFLKDGAIGSHLENLQRREGFKGFNQQAVSAIIAATDPRLN